VVTTLTETVAGEIVMLMPVTGSVHVELVVLADEVEVVVEQTMAVLTGLAPHEARLSAAAISNRNSDVFHHTRSSTFDISNRRFSLNVSPECLKIDALVILTELPFRKLKRAPLISKTDY
jgi:hypothetical protein